MVEVATWEECTHPKQVQARKHWINGTMKQEVVMALPIHSLTTVLVTAGLFGYAVKIWKLQEQQDEFPAIYTGRLALRITL